MGTNDFLNAEGDKYLIVESVIDIAKECVWLGVKDVFVSNVTVNTRCSSAFIMQLSPQQSSSYSRKRNEDYLHADAILKSPSFSAPEEFNDAKIGLKVLKENSPN